MSFRLPAFAAWNQRILQPLRPPQNPRTDGAKIGRETSPLTVGILPENLRTLAQGKGIGVELWNRWPEMLTGLSAVGEVLVITCSECAVLGKYLTYPALATDAAHSLATDAEGEFDLSFPAWASARALHFQSPHGHQYGVEIRGWQGETLHKICLQSDSHLAAFLEWIQVHQAAGAQPFERRTMVDEEPDLQSESIPAEDHLFVAPELLGLWICRAIEQRMPIRALVGNQGVVQGHCFVPRNLRKQGPWHFASSDEVGLHLDPAKIGKLVLHNIAPDGPACWTLKAYGPSGQLSLALTPTAASHRELWTSVARDIFPELQDR